MTRPALYGSQHSLRFFSKHVTDESGPSDQKRLIPHVIVGHCCESGDLITCASGDSNQIKEIGVPEGTKVGDYAVIKGTGAYCSAMSLKNYNSFPEAAEVLVRSGAE